MTLTTPPSPPMTLEQASEVEFKAESLLRPPSEFELETTQTPLSVIAPTDFWLTMTAILAGNFIVYLNALAATASQRYIGTDFHDVSGQNYIFTGFIIGFAATQALLGKFSDLFGRVAVFNSTLFFFVVGTVFCGLAPSMSSLIGGRVLQGIGAAGQQIVGVMVIVDLTTPDNRGWWLGILNLVVSPGLAGPILSTILSENTSWRWQFWVTVFLACMRSSAPHRRKQSMGNWSQLKGLDLIGCILAVGIPSTICLAMEIASKQLAWRSPAVILLLALGVLLVPPFVYFELKVVKDPIVDIRSFQIQSIPIACLMNFLSGAGTLGAIVFLPLYLTDIKHSSVIISSVQMLGILLSLGLSSSILWDSLR